MWKQPVGHKTIGASVRPLRAGSQHSHMSDQTAFPFGSDSGSSLISQV